MAGRSQRGERTRSRDERHEEEVAASHDGDGALALSDVARVAMEHIAALTGKRLLGATSVEATEEGWVVGVEVLEDARIPSSSDILAMYAAQIDPDGDLVGYRRVSRYVRGSTDRASWGGSE